MDEPALESALDRAEQALAAGGGLRGTGFWRAVDSVRGDAALVERHAERIAAIDRRAFEDGARLKVAAAPGLLALIASTTVGVIAVVVAARAGEPPPPTGWLTKRGVDLYHVRGFVPIAFLVGLAALLVGTHSLTHWVVGRALGIRFTHVFLGGPKPPRPGLKTDYASYLRATPRRRAVMLASGAVVTKILPFALLPVTLGLYNRWPWLTWILLALGSVQIATDALLSTKTSDWSKVLRELRAARG
jgi:hypothetical protein